MAKRKVEDIGRWARQTKILTSMDLALKEARDQYWLQGSSIIPHLEMKMGKAKNGKKQTAFTIGTSQGWPHWRSRFIA